MKKYNINTYNEKCDKPRVLLGVREFWGEEGISTYLLMLTKGLEKNGWEVAIVSGTKEIIRKKFESQGIKHFYVNFPDFQLFLRDILKSMKALVMMKKVVREFKPDVIYLNSFSLCLYGWIFRFMYKIPVVFTTHLEFAKNSKIKIMSFSVISFQDH